MVAGTHDLLSNLALVLCVAAVTTVAFQRLHQPVVVGYLLAGLLVGPNVPLVPLAHTETIEDLSELGIILLMFSLGLEFSLPKLIKISQTSGLIALIEVSLMLSLGYGVGQVLGLGPLESVFAGGIISISSTTIVAKAFTEQKVEARLREIVYGILVAEDLLAVLLVTVLTAVASGAGLSADVVLLTIGRLALFLVVVAVVGLLVIPRFVRFVLSFRRPETTVVACIGICFAVAFFAEKMGYSVALGAFLAGSLVGESGESKAIEHVIEPVRDVFAAIFFVSVGMLIDPALVFRHGPKILVFTGTVVLGKIVGVSIGAFLAGNPIRESVKSGMSLAQIGEFSFIIAALGLHLGATGELLYPVAVAVSVLTTLSTPWLIQRSGPIATYVERRLPKPVHTFATLYGAWIARLFERPHQPTFRTALRRIVRLLLLDVALLVAVIIGTSLATPAVSSYLVRLSGIAAWVARAVLALGAAVLAAPFLVGIVRCARSLGIMIAQEALPSREEVPSDAPPESTALLSAPPRALVVALQIAIALVIGLPVVAVTAYFLPALSGAALFTAMLALFTISFFRSASHLEGQLTAGAGMIVELLAKQRGTSRPGAEASTLENAVQHAIPWFGALHSIELPKDSDAAGKTLAEIGLRGRTGATVVAVRRGQAIILPSAEERLAVGDVLALTGSERSIQAARLVLGPTGGADDGQTELQITRV